MHHDKTKLRALAEQIRHMSSPGPCGKWAVYDCRDSDKGIHVIPLDDVRKHAQETTCECGPTIDFEDGMIVIHRAYDGRA